MSLITLDDFDRQSKYADYVAEASEDDQFVSYLIFNCGEHYIYKKDGEYYVLAEEQMTCETFGDKTWLDDYVFIGTLNLLFKTREERLTRLFSEFCSSNFNKHSKYREETAKLLVSKLNYGVISSLLKSFIRERLMLSDDAEIFIEFDTEPTHLPIKQVIKHNGCRFIYDIKRKAVATDEWTS